MVSYDLEQDTALSVGKKMKNKTDFNFNELY